MVKLIPDATLSPMKACSKCGHELPATTEFFCARGTGFYPDCKPCRASQYRAYYAANTERVLGWHRSYREANAERMAEYQRAYKAANPEKVAQTQRAYQVAHPERCAANARNRRAVQKGSGGSHTAEDIAAQHARQKGKCFWCGAKVARRYHVDHVVPLALGGSNGPENLVVACPLCNMRKKAKHPMDFAGILL